MHMARLLHPHGTVPGLVMGDSGMNTAMCAQEAFIFPSLEGRDTHTAVDIQCSHVVTVLSSVAVGVARLGKEGLEAKRHIHVSI